MEAPKSWSKHLPPPQCIALGGTWREVSSYGQDAVQYTLGAHRDLGADQVGKAQISFNVPVSATSRTAHGRPGLATTADRPGQVGPSCWPLAAGSLCRTFAFSSPGRKEPPSPPAIEITTQHAPSAGSKLTRVYNLFRCPRSLTYPEATLALQLLLQLTPQLRACGLLCRATAAHACRSSRRYST